MLNGVIEKVNAQQNVHPNNVFVGLGIGFYRSNPLSLDAHWVRHKKLSFILQCYYYSYKEPRSLSNNLISNEFTTTGFSIKPGIVPIQYENNFIRFYTGLQAVLSANEQQLALIYQDAFGEKRRNYNQTNLTYGAELTGSIQYKVAPNFYFETGIKVGLKPNKLIFQNPEVPNYNSYYNYAPSQGFGKDYFYSNVILGLGYYLN